MSSFFNDPYGMNMSYNPFQANRVYSSALVPGFSSGNTIVDLIANIIMGQNVFPRPQGNSSIFDMMMLRSRNLDQHHIMKRALASSQLMQRMGGINMESPIYSNLYPLLAMPDSPVWKAMAPLIGGNPVKAQMGLYADLNGQTLGATGRIGSITAAETDRLMDTLQGKFYQQANFGKYVGQVEAPLKRVLGDEAFARISKAWTPETLRSFEADGVTAVNRDVGEILSTAAANIAKVTASSADQTKKTESIDTIKIQARQAALTFLTTVSGDEARNKMTTAFAKALDDTDVKVGATKFQESYPAEKQDAVRQIQRGIDIRAGRVPGDIDYSFTRGFNIEDLTGAYGMAARTGLISRKGGPDVAGFVSSSAGVLDAARGLFGNDLSGRELQKELSDLIGTGYVNMGDETQAGKLEDLLRGVKAMARVAGVEIESMKGIIDEAKALAARNPHLSLGLSGLEAMRMSTKVMSEVTAGMTYMDPREIRNLGGPVGMVSRGIAANVQAKAEPISQQLAALYHRAVITGGADSQVAKDILTYVNTGNTTQWGRDEFIGRIAPRLDMSPLQAMTFAQTSPLSSALGLQSEPKIAEAGLKAARTQFLFTNDIFMLAQAGVTNAALDIAYNTEAYEGMSDEAVLAKVQKTLSKPLTDPEKKRILDVRNAAKLKQEESGELLMLPDVQAALGAIDPTGIWADMQERGQQVNIIATYNPNARAAQDRIVKLRDQAAQTEKYLAKELAPLNAPIPQRLFQEMISGNLSTTGFQGLREILTGGPGIVTVQEELARKGRQQQVETTLPSKRLEAMGRIVEKVNAPEQRKILQEVLKLPELNKFSKATSVSDLIKQITAPTSGVTPTQQQTVLDVLYKALPADKQDEAATQRLDEYVIPDIAKIMYPGINIPEVAGVATKVGLPELREITKQTKALDRTVQEIMGQTSFADLHDYLISTDSVLFADLATKIKSKSGNANDDEKEEIAKTVLTRLKKTRVAPLIAKAVLKSGRNQEDVAEIAANLQVIDSRNEFTGDPTALNLTRFAYDSFNTTSDIAVARETALAALAKVEQLQDDPVLTATQQRVKKEEVLQKQLGLTSDQFKDTATFLKAFGVVQMRKITELNPKDKDLKVKRLLDTVRLSGTSLPSGTSADQVTKLKESAAVISKMVGSQPISTDVLDFSELIPVYRRELYDTINRSWTEPKKDQLGQLKWKEMEAAAEPATQAHFETIRNRILGSQGNFNALAKKLTGPDAEETKTKINEIFGSDGHGTTTRNTLYDTLNDFNKQQFITAPPPGDVAGKGLFDVQGIIEAITKLTSSIQAAATL